MIAQVFISSYNSGMKKNILYLFTSLAVVLCPASILADGVIDRIVASVDGEPITLSDVVEMLPGESPADFATAREHPAFRRVVDDLIAKKLLLLEGKARRIAVTDREIEAYVQNVAAHNQLSIDEFRSALVKEGRTLEQFKKTIHIEILRSKLANSLIQEGGGVTDADIKQYIAENYGSESEGEKQLKLRQVLIRGADETLDTAREQCETVVEEFHAGTPFEELATKYSQSPEANNGGDLGIVAERDLNPVIFDAILTVKNGGISPVTISPMGCHVFYVEDRFDSSVSTEKLEEEVRVKLNQQKVEEKFQTYFVSEIYKNHTVEKKV